MPGRNQDRWEDVLCILAIHVMPGEHFVLKMHASWAMDNNRVGARSNVGHYG